MAEHTETANWRVSIGGQDPQWRVARQIQATMYDIQEACNHFFRNTYEDAAAIAIRVCRERGLKQIVELGAGSAPLTKLMAKDPSATGLQLIVCDLNPDRGLYQALERDYPTRVKGIMEPVNFCLPRQWPPGTLLALVNSFPAIAEADREKILKTLFQSADCVLAYEGSRKSLISMAITTTAFFAGWLTPLVMLRQPGRLRRFLWCWLIPAAPIFYVIDGLWWNLRCWTDHQWRTALQHLPAERQRSEIKSTVNTQVVIW